MMAVMVVWAMIVFVWGACLWIVHTFDKPDWQIRQNELVLWTGVSIINALMVESIAQDIKEVILLSVMAGCLIFASMTDYKAYEVYQFLWWIGGVLVLFLGMEDVRNFGELLFFCVLQEGFFCRFYGRADCHAFVLCALVFFGRGMGLKECLIHMLLAFGGLAMVQLFRKNINRKGNLKEQVAFLPYITVGFWINCYCF